MVNRRVLQGESLKAFNEGIDYVFNHWDALQNSIYYHRGGDNSHLKAKRLIDDVRDWFIQSNDPLHIDDLKGFINERLLVDFNLQIADGSDEHIAVELMVTHEDCLNGNFMTIEFPREANRNPNFYPSMEEVN
ncbi:Pre-rRNA-processing protein TSR2, motif protein [Medicago truncatula]|uniref:Pre-rRNA-processing protein TSR2, motif protein n=1 Tax=Medicago truncatula TaxID=3880 RepID=G7LJ78_MEDTR|nr:Pre-rRNA-processing protein TSR2, motif protein [Medicago truncatula]